MHHKIILPKHIIIRDTQEDVKMVIALYHIYKKEQEEQRKMQPLFVHPRSKRAVYNYTSLKHKTTFTFNPTSRLMQLLINVKPYILHPFTTINKFYDTIFFTKA